MSAEPRPPRDFDASLPPGFDVICRTALAKDPSARYQSGQALSDALRAQAAGHVSPGLADAELSAAETQVVPSHVVTAAAAGTPPKGIAPVPGPTTVPAPSAGAPGANPGPGAAAPAKKRGSPIVLVVSVAGLLTATAAGFWFWRSTQPTAQPEVQAPVTAAPLVSAPPETPANAGQTGAPPASPAPAMPPAPVAKSPAGTPVTGKSTSGTAGKTAVQPRISAAAAPVPAPPQGVIETPAPVPQPTGRVYESTAVDVKPAVKTQTPPSYPDALREKGVEATVVLRVLVTETGLVSDVKVLRPASEPAFNDAAMAAVRGWTFTPGMKKGQAVPCWYAVGVPFQVK